MRLDALYNPELEVPLGTTREQYAADEARRLALMLAIARTAGEHPRRIEEASDEDLKLDKMRSKRVAHSLSQVLTAWNGKEPHLPNGDNVRREAARLEWDAWWKEHDAWLNERMVFLATWAKRTGQPTRWSRQALMRLENEQRWLANAMRE